MQDIGLIYKITNTVNNKCYIGKTIQKLKDRIHDHLSKWSNCRKLKEALNIYGKEVFTIEIVQDNIPYSELDLLETFYIDKYNSIKEGYNIKRGNSNFRGRKMHSISSEIKRAIITEYKNGVSPLLIAEHFKLGLTSIYNTLSDIPKRRNKGGFNSKAKINIGQLIEFKRAGKGTSFIAEYFNVARSSVKRMVNRHKDIIFPRVSDILTDKAEDENVL